MDSFEKGRGDDADGCALSKPARDGLAWRENELAVGAAGGPSQPVTFTRMLDGSVPSGAKAAVAEPDELMSAAELERMMERFVVPRDSELGKGIQGMMLGPESSLRDTVGAILDADDRADEGSTGAPKLGNKL